MRIFNVRLVRGLVLGVALGGGILGCGSGEDSGLSSALGASIPPGVEQPGADVTLGCEEARFFRLINLYRVANGKSGLAVSKLATEAARWHAQDMGVQGYFSHTDSKGRGPQQRLADFGFNSTSGENIAAGNRQASATFCQWKNSAGHNRNMLEASFAVIGIGRAEVSGSMYGAYWSTPFGWAGDDSTTAPSIRENERATCTLPSALPAC